MAREIISKLLGGSRKGNDKNFNGLENTVNNLTDMEDGRLENANIGPSKKTSEGIALNNTSKPEMKGGEQQVPRRKGKKSKQRNSNKASKEVKNKPVDKGKKGANENNCRIKQQENLANNQGVKCQANTQEMSKDAAMSKDKSTCNEVGSTRPTGQSLDQTSVASQEGILVAPIKSNKSADIPPPPTDPNTCKLHTTKAAPNGYCQRGPLGNRMKGNDQSKPANAAPLMFQGNQCFPILQPMESWLARGCKESQYSLDALNELYEAVESIPTTASCTVGQGNKPFQYMGYDCEKNSLMYSLAQNEWYYKAFEKLDHSTPGTFDLFLQNTTKEDEEHDTYNGLSQIHEKKDFRCQMTALRYLSHFFNEELLPKFKSNDFIIAKTLTKEIYGNLFVERTRCGFTLDRVMRPALQNELSVISTLEGRSGAVAGDEESYIVFFELFLPTIKELHPEFDPNVRFQKCSQKTPEWNSDSLPTLTAANLDQISVVMKRSLRHFPFTVAMQDNERFLLVKLLQGAYDTLPQEYEEKTFLLLDNLPSSDEGTEVAGLVEKMTPGCSILKSAGAAENWPQGRAMWRCSHQNGCKVQINVNTIEHLEIICSRNDTDVLLLLTTAMEVEKHLDYYLEHHGFPFAWNSFFGYLNAFPENTGLSMSFRAKCKHRNLLKNPSLREAFKKAKVGFLDETEKGTIREITTLQVMLNDEIDLAKRFIRVIYGFDQIEAKLQSYRSLQREKGKGKGADNKANKSGN